MLKRAGSALATAPLIAGLALSGLLLAGSAQAGAATAGAAKADSAVSTGAALAAQQNGAPVSIAITGMSPSWASPRSRIKVTGSLTNTSKQPTGIVTVQLLASSSPITSMTALEDNAAQLYNLAGTALPGATWRSAGQLAPGASVRWSITLRARAIGMTTFGVYPLAALALDAAGTPLASTTTYLPYLPARKGPYRNSRPARLPISWVWPLIDKPLLNEPWQDNCQGPQARALARSLAPGGRLDGLVAAGQLAAGRSGLTWAVDPALLANASALTTCGPGGGGMARAASAWLARVRAATARQPLFATPYADVDVAALNRYHDVAADAERAFRLGWAVAGTILHRNVTPSTGQLAAPGYAANPAGIAWPAGGIDADTLEPLSAVDGISTIVLGSSAMPAQTSSVVRVPDSEPSRYVTVLLASDPLAQAIISATSAPGSAFAASQQFLAETAVLAEQNPAEPIVVAPPQRWQPPAGLAAELLANTASAPWLSPASLTSLTARKSIPIAPPPDTTGGQPGYRPNELRQLSALDSAISELESIRVRPDLSMYAGVATIESSAWQGKSSAGTRPMLSRLANRLYAQLRGVQIIADSRITLGGLKGSVPVSIDNSLGYPVMVRVGLIYSRASGIRIHPEPPIVAVDAHADKTIRLKVQAMEVGSTTVTLQLLSQAGRPLPVKRLPRMTIEATQVGILGMIIFAAALGVFLIASAARAVRRGRPLPGADQEKGGNPPADDVAGAGGQAAGPDTVMPEHRELGTARTPGL